jgi:hypothetical protein
MFINTAEPGRPHITIYYAHALCVLDIVGCRHTINILIICNTYSICTVTMVTRTHTSVTLYVLYITCLVFNSYCWARSLKFVFNISVSDMTQIKNVLKVDQ